MLLAGEEFSLERIVTPSEKPFKTLGLSAATVAIALFSAVLPAQSTPDNTPIYAWPSDKNNFLLEIKSYAH